MLVGLVLFWSLVSVAVLSLLSYAFFCGMEVAFFSSNRLRLELESDSGTMAERALKYIFERQSDFLTTLFLWARFSLLLFLVSMIFGASCISPYSLWVTLPLSLLVAGLLLLLTVNLTLVLVAKCNPTTTFRFFSLPLMVVVFLSRPLVAVIQSLSKWMKVDLEKFAPFSINAVSGEKEAADESALEGGEPADDVDDEVRMFQNALDFSNVTLSDCIVPRTEIAAIDVNSPVEKLTELFVTLHYSRILVYKDNIDNILGYVHSLDLFDNPMEIKDMLNPLPVVPESMSANRMLRIFLQQHKGMALVVDEFGGTAGIVTLEDIMEEIFGEIEDEHDEEGDGLVSKHLGNGEYVLSGRLEVESVNERYGLHLPLSNEYITIAGLILYKNSMLPQPKEKITIDNYEFTIVRVVLTRIELVRLSVKH